MFIFSIWPLSLAVVIVSWTNQPDITGSRGSRYGVCTLQAFNLANVRIPLRVSMFFAQHI